MNKFKKIFLIGYILLISGMTFFSVLVISICHVKGAPPIQLYRFISTELRTFILKYKLTSIPTYSIKLPKKAYANMKDTITLAANKYNKNPFHRIYIDNHNNSENSYQKCKIYINEKEIKAKIKLHGSHYLDEKKSYAIKLRKDQYHKKMKRFSFIIPTQLPLSTLVNYRILKHFIGWDIDIFLCQLKINGINQGLYLVEEKLSKTLLEKNNMAGVDLIKSKESWGHQYNETHITPFINELSNTLLRNFSGKQVGQLERYRQLYTQPSYESLSVHMDIPLTAKLDALRTFYGNSHVFSGDNMRLLYNTSNSKFFPFLRIEAANELIYDNYAANFEKKLYSYGNRYNMFKNKYDNNIIFKKLIESDTYRNLRNKYIAEFLKDETFIRETVDNVYNEFVPLITIDPKEQYYKKQADKEKSIILNNISKLKHYLNYTMMYVNIWPDNNKLRLEIVPDSNAAIQNTAFILEGNQPLRRVRIKDLQTKKISTIRFPIKSKTQDLSSFFSTHLYQLGLTEELDIEKRRYKYEILDLPKGYKLKNTTITFKNTLTNHPVKDNNIHTYVGQEVGFSSKEHRVTDITSFMKNTPELSMVKLGYKQILIKKGSYLITKTIVFPHGVAVALEEGVTITLGPSVSLLFQGNTQLRGTKESPIVIQNQQGKDPFGVVAMVGDRHSTQCEISYLDISGGSEATVNGKFLSGALSLYSHKYVSIQHSNIHHNFADDGVNIKYAKINLKNNTFLDNSADQLDLDVSHGHVSNTTFKFTGTKIPNQKPNGDGLDLSGAEIIVKDCYISGFLDKGMSVGESSKVYVSKNIFDNNRSAITIKDNSQTIIEKNIFRNNTIGIEMYLKKYFFGVPKLYGISRDDLKQKHSIKNGAKVFVLADNKVNKQIMAAKDIDKLLNLNWMAYD
ncbi:MAG: right-handed parallel beta-helix repeat-containing protein [bacterium]